ncbi:Beta-galactosidase [Pontiella sulfatireligans]|uniref:Beta-galactosidase n=2 Tax=Pontiella sulfatireligans TaxID=2750658 RepID=A0A6C2UG60_9BACT|nr:Beta-galactosidase [Pontiella sulfatireligans]
MALLTGAACAAVPPSGMEWNNPAIIQVGAEAPRATFTPYPDRAAALRGGPSDRVYSLNGDWKFAWAPNPNERPLDFQGMEFDDSCWGTLPVPSNWQLHGHGIAYNINTGFGFDFSELKAPVEGNEIGSYRHRFDLPKDWDGKEVSLHFGGVGSAFYLWVNGEYVGYSQGSKTPAEFNVSSHLKAGGNLIAAQVFRWSDASLFEDQDTWRLSGIFRGVYLWAADATRIKTYEVKASLSDDFKTGLLEVDATLSGPKGKVAFELLDADDQVVARSDGSSNVFSCEIPGIKPWSAEQPYLYRLLISRLDDTGTVREVIPQNVGFRRVEIKNGRFLVNGRDVLIKGVNRPEHDPRTGQVISRELQLSDMALMKNHNINAIRTAHYPNTPLFYDLCDQYGFYVMDEANLENHGMLKDREHFRPIAEDPLWLEPQLDRVRCMVERDINHPSIVIWSVGNEFFYGPHTMAVYDWIHARDPSRPINSEPGQYRIRDGKADFASRMYMEMPELQSRLASKSEQHVPIILIEYCHAQGNSCGGLKEYWDVFYADNRAQGAFVWDWRDQGIMQPVPEKDRAAYGQDEFAAYGPYFGSPSVPVGNAANMDGLVLSSGAATPGLQALKYVQRYIHVAPVDLSKGEFAIKNWYDFSRADDKQSGSWKITCNGEVVANGELGPLDLGPREEKTVALELPAIRPEPGAVYHILFEFRAKADAIPFVEEGTVLGWDQFELPNSAEAPRKDPAAMPKLEAQLNGDALQIQAAGVALVFNKTNGKLTSYKLAGKELLKAGPQPDFWRALTDNDSGCGLGGWGEHKKLYASHVWKDVAASWKVDTVDIDRSDPKRVVIAVKGSLSVGAQYAMQYTVYGNGEMVVACDFESQKELPALPRFGTEWQLDESFGEIKWFGRGPWPTYADRRFEPVGRYQSTVVDNRVDYHRPQENGNKVDVKWFAVLDKKSTGLAFVGEALSVNAQAYSKAVMQKAQFPWQLKRDGRNYINVDLAQMGVGGDNSWGAIPHEEYLLKDKSYHLEYRVVPIRERSDLNTLL